MTSQSGGETTTVYVRTSKLELPGKQVVVVLVAAAAAAAE